MKLYTEEQVRELLNGLMQEHWVDECLSHFTPIELPSDEEIEKEAEESVYNEVLQPRVQTWENGAKWVIDKIKNQQ